MYSRLVLVFLDTTELSMDSTLSSAGWLSLRRAVKEQQLSVAVSEVTVGELSRQVSEKVAKYNEMVRDQARQIRAHLGGAWQHEGVDGAFFERDLRRRLTEAGVTILDLPQVSHADLLNREFSGRRPFKRNGSGYRDALIWMTFMEWLEGSANAEIDAYFVSGNRSDFAEQSGSLHPDFSADLPPGVSVKLVDKLHAVVEATRPPLDWLGVDEPAAPAAAIEAALAEFEAHLGFPIEDLPIEEPYIDIPAFDRGFVISLTVDRDSVETTLVDMIDNVQIWDVSAVVGLVIEARVWNWDEVRNLPDGWARMARPAGPEHPCVRGAFSSTWEADVRIEGEGRVADAALTRVVLQPPQL